MDEYKNELEACRRQINARPAELHPAAAAYRGQWMPPLFCGAPPGGRAK